MARQPIWSSSIQNGPPQGCPFGRIRAGAQLIQQYQALGVRRPQDGGDTRHVRAKCAERLLQTLLIADIGEDLVEQRYGAALSCRDVHARLRHQTKQASRLQRNGFAARVRPGDDQQMKPIAEADIDRYNLAGRRYCRTGLQRNRYSNSGCRACRSQSRPSVLISGSYIL